MVPACWRESAEAGCMRIHACGAPFWGANCPSGSMKFLEDDGLRLKQPSSLETLLLDWERVALAHSAGRRRCRLL